MILRLATLLALIAAPALAQFHLPNMPIPEEETRGRSVAVASGSVAVLRSLDKVSGTVSDLEIPVGGTATAQRLTIAVTACRYPVDNPTSDAFVFLTITDTQRGEVLFQGWMIAASPGLNALDHARQDVWALACR